ncbi:hypothetical protein [Methylobacterium aquaticum]|jgi:hypothetical protein|uniref:Uncharacterized protein n=1 Tax=Methylobacterium aquaticum TaxID=270351 RepID=A0A0J6SKV4_9HYPH|nr:hypothetical protein [Methylobacterium aquaticum]KMO34299.1 hypothetical protein VP06_14610 [Methylobacterium aquaticum]
MTDLIFSERALVNERVRLGDEKEAAVQIGVLAASFLKDLCMDNGWELYTSQGDKILVIQHADSEEEAAEAAEDADSVIRQAIEQYSE